MDWYEGSRSNPHSGKNEKKASLGLCTARLVPETKPGPPKQVVSVHGPKETLAPWGARGLGLGKLREGGPGRGSGAAWFSYLSLCGGCCPCYQRLCVQIRCGEGRREVPRARPHPSASLACRQLVNAGVLTVRDAGSWWLAVPGAGKFIKYFVKGTCLWPGPTASPAQPSSSGPSGVWALLTLPVSWATSRAPGCPRHGPEGQVPGAALVRASGPAGTRCCAARPGLPCP